MITLTENEYNLVVYCIEQQMYEFNKKSMKILPLSLKNSHKLRRQNETYQKSWFR